MKKDLLFYENGEQAHKKAEHVLKDEALFQTIAQNAKEKVEKHHTWDQRAEELIYSLASYK